MKPSAYILAVLCLMNGGLLHAASCVGLKNAQNTRLTGVFDNIKAAILSDTKERADCGSLASVLDKLSHHSKQGGLKLEEDKPLDVAKAQANLAEAMRNPAVLGRLKQLQNEVQDQNVRLVYEAAIFDEEGYYGARELRIEQLQQRLK